MKPVVVFIAAAASLAAPAFADFSYQESVKITGGMMMRMQGGTAPAPQESASYVKGNRMARLGPDRGQITDLDKETVTNLNFKNKTYSVMTFAQMKAMLARVSPNAGKPDAAGAVDVQSHETGKTRVIGGVTAKEMLVTVKVSGSEIDSDVWMAPMIAGYDEVRQFHTRMAQKMGSAGVPGMQRSVEEAVKLLTKYNGVPVLQTSSIINGEMPAGAGTKGPMIETSTELRGFSSAAVDASKFEVPAGFQKIDQNMGMPPNGSRPAPPPQPHQ
jgi:hypothetical protein